MRSAPPVLGGESLGHLEPHRRHRALQVLGGGHPGDVLHGDCFGRLVPRRMTPFTPIRARSAAARTLGA